MPWQGPKLYFCKDCGSAFKGRTWKRFSFICPGCKADMKGKLEIPQADLDAE